MSCSVERQASRIWAQDERELVVSRYENIPSMSMVLEACIWSLITRKDLNVRNLLSSAKKNRAHKALQGGGN